MPRWVRRTAVRARAKLQAQADYLRKLRRRHGRSVEAQLIRGVAFGVGSGAVSLLVIWYETRR
jgi:hypothetical protein